MATEEHAGGLSHLDASGAARMVDVSAEAGLLLVLVLLLELALRVARFVRG